MNRHNMTGTNINKSLTLLQILVLLATSLSSITSMDTNTKSDPTVTINNYGSCSKSTSTCDESSTTEARLQRLESQMDVLTHMVMNGSNKQDPIIRDCTEVKHHENQSQGIFILHPAGSAPFEALCIFDQDGTWTVIQQRIDGQVDFQRCWQEYCQGFGSFNSSFYLGNNKIHAITHQKQYKLKIDLTDWSNMSAFAEYRYFYIEDESAKYKLHYANFSGTAGDSLAEYHQGMLFSTFDQDNDKKASGQCAVVHGGGWWFRDCDRANLNGFYTHMPELKGNVDAGIEWDAWMEMYSFKETRMMVTPAFPN